MVRRLGRRKSGTGNRRVLSQSLDSLTVGLSSFNTILFQPSFSFLTEHDLLCWSLKVGIAVLLQFPCEGFHNNIALSFVLFVIFLPFFTVLRLIRVVNILKK